MKNPRRSRRGFSLLTVTLMVALVTISSLVVIELVTDDQVLLGFERRTREAREAAEGGGMEALNDVHLGDALPSPDSADLALPYQPGADSFFSGENEQGIDRSYTAEVRLVRTTPVLESSHTKVRAVVYEIDVSAEAGIQSGARGQGHIFRMVSSKPGVVMANRHAH